MAKKPEETNTLDIPDEFDNNTEYTTSGTLNLDDLDTIGFNDDQEELERARLYPPTGNWEKNDRWKFDKRVDVGNCQDHDLDVAGRTFFSFMGMPLPREKDGIEHQPMMFLRFSPDKRYKPDKPKEVDQSYKIYLQAKDLFVEVNGEKPKTQKQLIEFIEEATFIVRTWNAQNGPAISDIYAKRVRR